MKTIRLTAIGFILALVAHAQEAKRDVSLTANPVYQQNCAKCHGKTAQGRTFAGPSLSSEKAAALSTDDLRNIITNGKHRMPKFTGKLSPSEIDALVAQIKALKAQ